MVGNAATRALLSLLSEDVTFVSFGAISGKLLHLPAAGLIFKQVVVKGFWLAKILGTNPLPEKWRIVMELMSLVAAGDVSLQVGGVFYLGNIAALEKAVSLDGEREGLARDDMEIRKALALVSRLLNRIFKGIRELRAFNNLVNFSDIKIAEDEAVEEIAKLAKER